MIAYRDNWELYRKDRFFDEKGKHIAEREEGETGENSNECIIVIKDLANYIIGISSDKEKRRNAYAV